MAIIGGYWQRSERFWAANTPLFTALLRNTMLATGTFCIALLYVCSLRFNLGPIPNIVAPSCLVILGTMTLIGKRALTITLFDYYFVGFILLAVVSHIFAKEFLYKQLGLNDLQMNVEYILEMAFMYRAYFCLTLLSPKVASRFFIVSSIVVLAGVSLNGVQQRFGPGSAGALMLARQLSANGEQILLSAANGRVSGVFSSPNILGYAACVLAAFALGWGLYDVENIKMTKTAAVVGLMGLALLCTVACQSRQSAAVLVFSPIIFGVILKLKAKDARNILLLAVLTSIAAFGLVLTIATTKSTYLTNISKSGFKGDQSFEARAHELGVMESISGDIAAGGLGQSMSNENAYTAATEHAIYNPSVIDSEWGNMFQAFGVWGPLLLALFYLFTAQSIRDVWRVSTPEARLIALVSLSLLLYNLVLTATAVRVSKYESAGFTFEVLGVLSGWRYLGIQAAVKRRQRATS